MPASLYRFSHFAAFALFWVCLSHWLIHLSLPAPQVLPGIPALTQVHPEQAAALLGDTTTSASDTRFHLIGIVRLSRSSAAVISHDDAPASVISVGDEVIAGTRLETIDTRSVQLRQHGRDIELKLPAQASSAAIILR